ncbi:MAG: 3'(2'),5'-bisphosphate nucleotidase CysQ [Alcanivoracaceae bacterium]
MTDRHALLNQVADIARRAGDAILEVYNGPDFDVERKGDDSPLTAADLAAHRLILAGLTALTPDIPVHSEESEGITWEMRRHWSRYWLVDPLDGTKEFIKRNGEFTVNIALIESGVPVLGVVHVPVLGITYSGGDGLGAFRQTAAGRESIQVRRPVSVPVVMVASRSHGTDTIGVLEEVINREIGPVELTSMGSSLKLCLVAEGKADIYPRLAPTSEWDTAAADAVVRAAGGTVVNTAFEPLRYNKQDILNPHFLVLGASVDSWKFLQPVL